MIVDGCLMCGGCLLTDGSCPVCGLIKAEENAWIVQLYF
jgi:hypothetical protein